MDFKYPLALVCVLVFASTYYHELLTSTRETSLSEYSFQQMIQKHSSYEFYSKQREIRFNHQLPGRHISQERASITSQNSHPGIRQSDKYKSENGNNRFDLPIYQKTPEQLSLEYSVNTEKTKNASDLQASTELLMNKNTIQDVNKQDQVNSITQSKNSHEYQLVLLTTDSGFTERIQNKSRLFRSLADIYSKNYNFHCIMFTNTPELVNYYSNTSITIIQQFETNPYGLPIVTNLFAIAQKHFLAKYYGYVNADILVENNVFDVLHFLEEASRQGIITPMHELAGRVYEKPYTSFPFQFHDIHDVHSFFQTIPLTRQTLRNVGSADYFIFSRAAMVRATNQSQPVVVGRREIDNYLMGVMWNGKSFEERQYTLVDGTVVVHGIHIGRDGFYNRKVKQYKNNERWNFDVLNSQRLHHGFLREKGNSVIHFIRSNKTCCRITFY